MVEVRIEMLSLRNISSERCLVMIPSQNVINIIGSTRSQSDLGKISWPNSVIRVFGLILGKIRGVDIIVDDSVSVVPLLVVVLLVVVMTWVDGEHCHSGGEFELLVSFVQEDVVFSPLHSMAVSAVSGEDLESSSDGAGVEITHEFEGWPVVVAVVGSDFGDHFLVSFDSPEGSDIVSINPAFCCGFFGLGLRI